MVRGLGSIGIVPQSPANGIDHVAESLRTFLPGSRLSDDNVFTPVSHGQAGILGHDVGIGASRASPGQQLEDGAVVDLALLRLRHGLARHLVLTREAAMEGLSRGAGEKALAL